MRGDSWPATTNARMGCLPTSGLSPEAAWEHGAVTVARRAVPTVITMHGATREDHRSLTVALAMSCPYCASPTPVNGPLRTVSCDACLKEFEVREIAKQLESAAEGSDWLNSPFLSTAQSVFETSDVQCGRCDALIPVEPHLAVTGQTTTIPCPSCAAACPSYPAPDWLVRQLPAAVQVFGGDDPQDALGGATLETPQESPDAVLMTCPGCAGSLQVTADVERLMDCKYCGSSVFIPDPIWRRLHPVRLIRRWTLLFRGEELETLETIEEALEEKALEAEALESEQPDEAAREGYTTQSEPPPVAVTEAAPQLPANIVGAACTLVLGGLVLLLPGVPEAGLWAWWPNVAVIVFGAVLVGAGLRSSTRNNGELPLGRLLVVAGVSVTIAGALLQQIALHLTAS